MVLPGNQVILIASRRRYSRTNVMTFRLDIPEKLGGFATRPRQEKNEPFCGGPTHDVTQPRKEPETTIINVIHAG